MNCALFPVPVCPKLLLPHAKRELSLLTANITSLPVNISFILCYFHQFYFFA